MKMVYVMVPLFETSSLLGISEHVKNVLQIPQSTLILHQLDEDKYLVEIEHFKLSFQQINQIVEQHQNLQSQVQLLKHTLQAYEVELIGSTTIETTSNLDLIIKRAKKYKELKDENRKLRKLLHSQIQNMGKIREQTQTTMKVLRNEFDALALEISKQNSENKG